MNVPGGVIVKSKLMNSGFGIYFNFIYSSLSLILPDDINLYSCTFFAILNYENLHIYYNIFIIIKKVLLNHFCVIKSNQM
jgi:hypothetical protein